MPKLVFRVHALQRMFERGISVEDDKSVVERGATIQDYPADRPYPSRLILGRRDAGPLHVVVAEDTEAGILIVVTAYEPDPAQWEPGFRRKVK
jgi:hypothetical protein